MNGETFFRLCLHQRHVDRISAARDRFASLLLATGLTEEMQFKLLEHFTGEVAGAIQDERELCLLNPDHE